jgi:hypothetical protein
MLTAAGATMLTLKRASKSRPSGTWSDDDYDVFDGDRHIGRILWTHAYQLPKILQKERKISEKDMRFLH